MPACRVATSRWLSTWGRLGALLDGDEPPTTLTSGVTGLTELSKINKASGVLIGYGHHPNDVGDVLRRRPRRPRWSCPSTPRSC